MQIELKSSNNMVVILTGEFKDLQNRLNLQKKENLRLESRIKQISFKLEKEGEKSVNLIYRLAKEKQKYNDQLKTSEENTAAL